MNCSRELDYVVASVHSAFTMSEADMTERIIRAMENPYVTLLGHPTGRLLLKRDGYAVDIPAIARSGRGDRDVDRTKRRAEAARSRLALVAARQGERREMRDQSRRARSRAPAGFVVRRRRGAQRLAHKRRCCELSAAGKDRARNEEETRACLTRANCPGPRSALAAYAKLYRDPLRYLVAAHKKYGDIVHMQIGPRHDFLLNHPDYVRAVLLDTENFRRSVHRPLQRVLGQGLLTSKEPKHKKQRTMLQPIFHRQKIAALGGRDGRRNRALQ